MILKYIPGVIGAIAGFVVLQFVGWFANLGLEFTIYIAAYLIATISLHKALVRYGDKAAD